MVLDITILYTEYHELAKKAKDKNFKLSINTKKGTSDSRLDWFAVGDCKRLPNEVGGMDTTATENVGAR